jgi:hypothetical protein
MTVHDMGHGVQRESGYGPLLRRVLLIGVLFELSLLAGGFAAPLFESWLPQRPAPAADPTALRVQWRQSVSRPEADPLLRKPAPPLILRTPTGAPLDPAGLQGKRTVLLFTKGDSP